MTLSLSSKEHNSILLPLEGVKVTHTATNAFKTQKIEKNSKETNTNFARKQKEIKKTNENLFYTHH